MNESDKKVVNHAPMVEERNSTVRLNNAQKDGAGATF